MALHGGAGWDAQLGVEVCEKGEVLQSLNRFVLLRLDIVAGPSVGLSTYRPWFVVDAVGRPPNSCRNRPNSSTPLHLRLTIEMYHELPELRQSLLARRVLARAAAAGIPEKIYIGPSDRVPQQANGWCAI